MNVLFLTQWYPSPESPVAGIFVREHALAVARQHMVTVLHVKGMRPELHTIPRVEPVQDGPLTTYVVTYPPGMLPKTTWINRFNAVFTVVDSILARSIRPDILHANVYNTADLAYAVQWRYHIPAVITEHATAFPRRLITRRQRWIVRLCVNRMRLVMPVSQDLIAHMTRYGVHAPFQVVPNTVNTDVFYPAEGPREHGETTWRILVVAGLTPVKGIDFLLPALARVKQRGRKFNLTIAGDGPERGNLTELAQDLGIGDQVTFLGNRTKLEVAELMRQSDLLALTSRWDNQPVVLIEAMASGLPVVASRVGGIPEIVSQEQGLLVEVGDIDAITEKLEYLLMNYDNYPSSKIASYACSRFSHETVCNQLTDVYRQVLNGDRITGT